ncbi:MAG: hypothetical protein GY866_30480, partial [Proteobacteria bacterium]|nr:hypothetical protein [Pseudomonadota bacterium]
MTKNSPEYLKATDDDIALWYQTQLAKKHLDGFLNGYDPEDDELTTDQLRQKYNPKTLESKAIQFAAYDLDTQREKLIAAMTGTKAEV